LGELTKPIDVKLLYLEN